MSFRNYFRSDVTRIEKIVGFLLLFLAAAIICFATACSTITTKNTEVSIATEDDSCEVHAWGGRVCSTKNELTGIWIDY